MDTQKGLIGFFDILGYKSLLENNEPEIIADSVLPLLTNINKIVPDFLKNKVQKSILSTLEKLPSEKYNPQDLEILMYSIVDEIKWLIFSDSILLSMPIDSIDREHFIKIGVFFTVCTYLLRGMCDAGLPLRGAIDFGKYCIESSFRLCGRRRENV